MRKQTEKLRQLVLRVFRAEADRISGDARKEMKSAAEELAARGALNSGARIVKYLEIRKKEIETTVDATLSRLRDILTRRWIEWLPWTKRSTDAVVHTLADAVEKRYPGPVPNFPRISERQVKEEFGTFIGMMEGKISNEVLSSIDAVIRGKQQDVLKYLVLTVLVAVILGFLSFLGLK